jgi:hypothetical protein
MVPTSLSYTTPLNPKSPVGGKPVAAKPHLLVGALVGRPGQRVYVTVR